MPPPMYDYSPARKLCGHAWGIYCACHYYVGQPNSNSTTVTWTDKADDGYVGRHRPERDLFKPL